VRRVAPREGRRRREVSQDGERVAALDGRRGRARAARGRGGARDELAQAEEEEDGDDELSEAAQGRDALRHAAGARRPGCCAAEGGRRGDEVVVAVEVRWARRARRIVILRDPEGGKALHAATQGLLDGAAVTWSSGRRGARRGEAATEERSWPGAALDEFELGGERFAPSGEGRGRAGRGGSGVKTWGGVERSARGEGRCGVGA